MPCCRPSKKKLGRTSLTLGGDIVPPGQTDGFQPIMYENTLRPKQSKTPISQPTTAYGPAAGSFGINVEGSDESEGLGVTKFPSIKINDKSEAPTSKTDTVSSMKSLADTLYGESEEEKAKYKGGTGNTKGKGSPKNGSAKVKGSPKANTKGNSRQQESGKEGGKSSKTLIPPSRERTRSGNNSIDKKQQQQQSRERTRTANSDKGRKKNSPPRVRSQSNKSNVNKMLKRAISYDTVEGLNQPGARSIEEYELPSLITNITEHRSARSDSTASNKVHPGVVRDSRVGSTESTASKSGFEDQPSYEEPVTLNPRYEAPVPEKPTKDKLVSKPLPEYHQTIGMPEMYASPTPIEDDQFSNKKKRPPRGSILVAALGKRDIGSKVWVQDFGTMATLRYIGPDAKGIDVCGIEFTEPIGNSDGSADGKQYFGCFPNHGQFVSPTQVMRVMLPEVTDGAGTLQTPTDPGYSHMKHQNDDDIYHVPREDSGSNSTSTSQPNLRAYQPPKIPGTSNAASTSPKHASKTPSQPTPTVYENDALDPNSVPDRHKAYINGELESEQQEDYENLEIANLHKIRVESRQEQQEDYENFEIANQHEKKQTPQQEQQEKHKNIDEKNVIVQKVKMDTVVSGDNGTTSHPVNIESDSDDDNYENAEYLAKSQPSSVSLKAQQTLPRPNAYENEHADDMFDFSDDDEGFGVSKHDYENEFLHKNLPVVGEVTDDDDIHDYENAPSSRVASDAPSSKPGSFTSTGAHSSSTLRIKNLDADYINPFVDEEKSATLRKPKTSTDSRTATLRRDEFDSATLRKSTDTDYAVPAPLKAGANYVTADDISLIL